MIPEQTLTHLRRGAVLASRYRLEEVAGAGGMATVWRAHDQRLRRDVAIKVMAASLADGQTALARFSREARTHAAIIHPHLVRIYDYSAAGPQPYLVLEYVPGPTLATLLRQRRLGTGELTRLASEMLAATACIHDRGVLHRDIKPDNVLLDPQRGARLTDFGIAHIESATHLTRPGDVIGTLSFLAPELLEGDPPSRQSDLFALGVLLRDAAAPDALDARLQYLVNWLTSPGPGLRPADAHSALEALQEEVPPPPPQSRRQPRGRRRTALAGATAALAAIAALIVSSGALRTSATAHITHRATASSHPHHPPTLNARLDELTQAVKQAAKPQP